MQEIDQNVTIKMKGKPIGGWLWVIMVILIGSAIQLIISILTTLNEFLAYDWQMFFHTNDNLLKIRIYIYAYLIISVVIGLGILVWSLIIFFQKKKKFPTVFIGLLGYFILTEVLRIYFLDYYANLTDQDASNIESSLAKTGIMAIITGLYLNKGRRPNQTFVR